MCRFVATWLSGDTLPTLTRQTSGDSGQPLPPMGGQNICRPTPSFRDDLCEKHGHGASVRMVLEGRRGWSHAVHIVIGYEMPWRDSSPEVCVVADRRIIGVRIHRRLWLLASSVSREPTDAIDQRCQVGDDFTVPLIVGRRILERNMSAVQR